MLLLMTHSSKSLKLLLCLFLALHVAYSFAQRDLFGDTTAMQLTIVSAWDSLLADRGDSVSFHKARFIFKEGEEQVSMRVKISARGHFRKSPAVCTFPPIKVKIAKEYRKDNMFAKHKNLKLVCHCREESAILQEYLVYKTYQLFTPYSFKVRLAEITYVDLKGIRPPEKHYGFFIEDDKRVAKRMGGKRFDASITQMDSVDREAYLRINAFMYMVGNMDYDILNRKNIKLIRLLTPIQ